MEGLGVGMAERAVGAGRVSRHSIRAPRLAHIVFVICHRAVRSRNIDIHGLSHSGGCHCRLLTFTTAPPSTAQARRSSGDGCLFVCSISTEIASVDSRLEFQGEFVKAVKASPVHSYFLWRGGVSRTWTMRAYDVKRWPDEGQ